MERIRLTTRLKASRLLEASNYGHFRCNLLKLYPDLATDAKRYGLDGDLQGSGFVLHHLNPKSNHKIPSCIKCEDLNKELQSKELNGLLRFKTFINKKGLKLKGKDKELFELMSQQELAFLHDELDKLDAEIKETVLIPEQFHNYLHSMNWKNILNLPVSRMECHGMYKDYLNDMASEIEIENFTEKSKTLSGQRKVINDIIGMLQGTDKEALFDALKTACEKLIDLLKEKRYGEKQEY